MTEHENKRNRQVELPAGQSEDVEFAEALADADDREAGERAEAADRRQQEQ